MKLTILQPLLVPFLLQISCACMAEIVAFPVTTHVERVDEWRTEMQWSVQMVDIPSDILDAFTVQGPTMLFNTAYVDAAGSTATGTFRASVYSSGEKSIAKNHGVVATTVRELLSAQNYEIGDTGVVSSAYSYAGHVDRCLSTAIVRSTVQRYGETVQDAYSSLLSSNQIWSPANVCAQTPPPAMSCSLTSPGKIDLGTNAVHDGGRGVTGRTQLSLSCNIPATVKIQSATGSTVRFASGGTGVQKIDGVGPGQKVYTGDASPQTLNYEITLNGDHKAGLIEGHTVLYLEYQ